jgi:hypothetical protein
MTDLGARSAKELAGVEEKAKPGRERALVVRDEVNAWRERQHWGIRQRAYEYTPWPLSFSFHALQERRCDKTARRKGAHTWSRMRR